MPSPGEDPAGAQPAARPSGGDGIGKVSEPSPSLENTRRGARGQRAATRPIRDEAKSARGEIRLPRPDPGPIAGVRVASERHIRLAPAQLFAMISRLENWPRWTSLWLRADVVSRRQNQAIVRLGGYVGGLPVESTVQGTTKSPERIEWRQAHGTLLDYAGGLEIAKDEDGSRVRYETAMDSGIPFLDEAAVHQVLVQEVERTLRRIKSSAEREILADEIRLMKARSQPASSAGSARPNDTRVVELAATLAAPGAEGPPAGSLDEVDDEGPVAIDLDAASEEPSAGGAGAAVSAAASADGAVQPKKRRRRRRRRPKGDVPTVTPNAP